MNHDFKTPISSENESMTYEFLITSLEEKLGSLKDAQNYPQKAKDLEASLKSIDDYNLMNMYRLQAEDYEILKGNLEYLTKIRRNM